MSNAEIFGAGETKPGLNEKPTLYSTVIHPHATSTLTSDTIESHLNPTGFQTTASSSNMFTNQEAARLGQMSIPVNLEMGSITNDGALSSYETPMFLSKNQRQLPLLPKVPMLSPNLVANSHADTLKIKGTLSAARNKSQKIRALNSEKRRLKGESKNITNLVSREIQQLLTAKGVGMKLNNLLQKYTMKLKRDQLSKLKLVDRVQIKNELKAKLSKEVEGFRTAGSEYLDVEKVDPIDLKRIVTQIKKKLGY